MRKLYLLFWGFLGLSFGQNQGFFVPRFPVKNASVVSQNEKILVIARRNQVFVSDFVSLREYELPFLVFDVLPKKSSCIVAGEGGVGVLRGRNFRLLSGIEEAVWQIISKDSLVWFIGESSVYRAKFSGDSLKLFDKISLPRRISGAAFADKVLWLNLEGIGLHILQGKAPVALPYAEKFQALPFVNLLRIGKKRLLFGYNSRIYDLGKKEVQSFSGEFAGKLAEEKILQVKKSGEYIYVLTRKNSVFLLNSFLEIVGEFHPKAKIRDIYPFEKHLLLATSEGVFLWKPDVPVYNTWIESENVLNLKFLQGRLYLFSREGISVFDKRLNFLEKLNRSRLIFTDGEIFQGDLIFSSNKGLWKYTKNRFEPFLPDIPVLNFMVFSDTFALRLLDKWIFVRKVKGKWQQITPRNPAYYLRRFPNVGGRYPFLFDFAASKEDTFFFLRNRHLFAVNRPLVYEDFPVKKTREGKLIDYYFQGRIVREQGKFRDIYFDYVWEEEKKMELSEKSEQEDWKNYWYLLAGFIGGIFLGMGIFGKRKRGRN